MSTRSALDIQVGGAHYKDSKIQPVEYIHANNIGFMEGSAIKYLSRHTKKNGRQDVEKALHFCQLILDLQYPEKKAEDNSSKVQMTLPQSERADLVMEIALLIHNNSHIEGLSNKNLERIKQDILDDVKEKEEERSQAAQSVLDQGFRSESGHHFQD